MSFDTTWLNHEFALNDHVSIPGTGRGERKQGPVTKILFKAHFQSLPSEEGE
jgi:hypothetical protein